MVRVFICLLIVFLFSCTPRGPFVTSYAVTERDCNPSQHLSVMTFNIRYENKKKSEPHWVQRRDHVVAVMKESEADIICLQEVLHGQYMYIEVGLESYAMLGVGRKDARIAGEAVPILFKRERFSLKGAGHFWLSETPDQAGSKGWGAHIPRMVTWILLFDHASKRELLVLNAHMDHRSTLARSESARLLLKRARVLQEAATTPGSLAILICGDFNCPTTSEPHALLCNDAGPDLKNAHLLCYDGSATGSFHGFTGEPKAKFIDWILYGAQLRCESAAVDQSHVDGTYPSDHFPLSAEFHYQP